MQTRAQAPESLREVGLPEGQAGVKRRGGLSSGLTAPLPTPSSQAASAGANSLSLSSPPTAASGLNSEAVATGSGRASLQSMKVLRMKMGLRGWLVR